ncbi:unnamed protein product [Clonostachys rosea]|uniref:Uncharacterized protein n=1 Tax=Bionectria ochroleuca TaxID=29856 RepID=A0ABY6U453_BIOOC|nr:unnamed protein product [Clonostachys rosea]
MPSQSSSNQPSSGSNNKGGASSSEKPPTRYRVVKDGWGDRPNFQHSHGLKMDPEGIEEGNLILDAYINADKGAGSSGKN